MRKKRHLAETVARRIRKQILSGELASGVHFNEVEFAERCGVSRSPIREAIRMLEHEGLLHTEASGRTKVSAWTSTDLHDLYDLRYDLEWKAAQTWLQQSWPVERSVDLLQVIADMEACIDDRLRFYDADLRFHQMLVAATGNQTLFRLWNTMTPAVMTLQEISNDEIDRDRLLGVIDDHRSIWTAIRERDADTLMIVLRRHMEDGRRLIAQVLERNLTERSLTTSNTKESIRR